jgi:signal transduction histidine kinase
LTVLGMNVAQLVRKEAHKFPQLAAELEKIQQGVRQLHNEIRTASYLLHPPLLDESGLSSALGWYVDGLVERSGLEISFHASEDLGRLPNDMELVVFRVVQECLTNIHRHSGSKTASIRLVREAGQVTIEIRDQGKGMSAEKLTEIQLRGSGLGIRGMRERLRQFDGIIKIDSGPQGTTVTANIPLPQPDAHTESAQVQPAQLAV